MSGYDRFGACAAPFLDESLFPRTKGELYDRNCAPNPLANGNGTCCIPCPVYDWLYSSRFYRLTDGAAWVNVAGFILCGILLLSYLVLPSDVARRSFLNVSLIVGVMFVQLGFIVPLGQQPDQCFDAVTPNNMRSSTVCAFTGSFIAFGLVTCVTWIMVRAVYMHLLICWSMSPNKYFNWGANVFAWTLVVIFTTAVLAHSGVSFRFGGYCHINSRGSIPTFWGWLFAFGAIALVLQLVTFAYCIKVYLTFSIIGKDLPSQISSASSTTSATNTKLARARAARSAALRVNAALGLHWRSLAIITSSIMTIVTICTIFSIADAHAEDLAYRNVDLLIPWIHCTIQKYETHDPSLDCTTGRLTSPFRQPEANIIAALFVLGFFGLEIFALLWRLEILRGWVDLSRSVWRSPRWRVSVPRLRKKEEGGVGAKFNVQSKDRRTMVNEA